MSNLTFEEFSKLSEKEKCIRYKELSNHDRFLARINAPITAESTGETFEFTEEDKAYLEKRDKEWQETLKKLEAKRNSTK